MSLPNGSPRSTMRLYTSPHQPATRYVRVLDDWSTDRRTMVTRRFLMHNPGNRLLPASCCHTRRPAKNLTVQVYYDALYIWCRPGKGCKTCYTRPGYCRRHRTWHDADREAP